MEYINKIKRMLCKELEEYAEKARITGADLEPLWKLTDIVKNLDKIEMLEENDYSEMYEGNSYARRPRDSRGRFTRNYSKDNYSRDDYSMENYPGSRCYSYDDGKKHMMSRIGEMMDGATADEKKILERALREMEHL